MPEMYEILSYAVPYSILFFALLIGLLYPCMKQRKQHSSDHSFVNSFFMCICCAERPRKQDGVLPMSTADSASTVGSADGGVAVPPETPKERWTRSRSRAEAANDARMKQVYDSCWHKLAVFQLLQLHRCIAERQRGERSIGGATIDDCCRVYLRFTKWTRDWPCLFLRYTRALFFGWAPPQDAAAAGERERERGWLCIQLFLQAITWSAVAIIAAVVVVFLYMIPLSLLLHFPMYWLWCASLLMFVSEDVLAGVSVTLYLNFAARRAQRAARDVRLAPVELGASPSAIDKLRAAQLIAQSYNEQQSREYAAYWHASSDALAWHFLVVGVPLFTLHEVLKHMEPTALTWVGLSVVRLLFEPWKGLGMAHAVRFVQATRLGVDAAVRGLARFHVETVGDAGGVGAGVRVGQSVWLSESADAFPRTLSAGDVAALRGSKQRVSAVGAKTAGTFEIVPFEGHVLPLQLLARQLQLTGPPQSVSLPLSAVAAVVGPTRPLRELLQEYEAAYLANEGHADMEKYTDAKLKFGKPHDAALGVHTLVRVPEKALWRGLSEGMAAICAEVERGGSDDDRRCLHYVLHEPCGSLETQWPHSGNKQMDVFQDPAKADGRAGKLLDYFVDHPLSRNAQLLPEHVVALRLYTTAAYQTINTHLRSNDAPHPFPVTVAYLTDGIKRLRAKDLGEGGGEAAADLWRGMRNVQVGEGDCFRDRGGTEIAPMSTSASYEVALEYSSRAEKRLLFKIKTSGFIDRGAGLQYLSAFPDEQEFLYPPLTFLESTGEEEVVTLHNGVEYTIIEVVPHIAS